MPKEGKQKKDAIVERSSSSNISGNKMKKNEYGGVYLSPEEISQCFSFLDPESTGRLTAGMLKKRLTAFFPDLTTKDYKYLLSNKKEITIEEIQHLLHDNEVKDFDPVAEAFKVYDPDNKGFITKDKIKDIFATYGYDDLSMEEIGLIIKAADVDGDGVISISDFRLMMDSHHEDIPLPTNQEIEKSTQEADATATITETEENSNNFLKNEDDIKGEELSSASF